MRWMVRPVRGCFSCPLAILPDAGRSQRPVLVERVEYLPGKLRFGRARELAVNRVEILRSIRGRDSPANAHHTLNIASRRP
jgi:hypothetical protein